MHPSSALILLHNSHIWSSTTEQLQSREATYRKKTEIVFSKDKNRSRNLK